jgi:hypothetical protein
MPPIYYVRVVAALSTPRTIYYRHVVDYLDERQGRTMTNIDQTRKYWDKQSRTYDKSMTRIEQLAFGDGRAWVCSQARGKTLEVAIGTGLNRTMCG